MRRHMDGFLWVEYRPQGANRTPLAPEKSVGPLGRKKMVVPRKQGKKRESCSTEERLQRMSMRRNDLEGWMNVPRSFDFFGYELDGPTLRSPGCVYVAFCPHVLMSKMD